MIDMNGSIENIMEQCDHIAFNEFKGDIANAYARRRDYETGTHSHKSGKHASDMGKIAVMNHDTESNGDGQKELDRHAFAGDRTKDRYDDYNSDAKFHAKQMNKRLDAERKYRKEKVMTKNESTSIFDALFDQF